MVYLVAGTPRPLCCPISSVSCYTKTQRPYHGQNNVLFGWSAIMIGKGEKAPSTPSPSRARDATKPEAALKLLDEWLKDESGYDEETWPELREALDRDRLSDRKLFDE